MSEDLPGGAMATRPVHFFWVLDCSGSMAGDKIGQLNWAINEALPDMRSVANENPSADLLLRAVTFSTGARWHIAQPTPVAAFLWSDVAADGVTDFGEALKLLAGELAMPPMPERALPPVIAVVSDGQPTDDWTTPLALLDRTPWGPKAVRLAIAIGQDADVGVLAAFTKSSERVFAVNNSASLARAIRWASTVAVRQASEPQGAVGSGQPSDTHEVLLAAIDDDPGVW